MFRNITICTVLIISYINSINAQYSLSNISNPTTISKVLIPKNGYYWMAMSYLKNSISYPTLVQQNGAFSLVNTEVTKQHYNIFEACNLPVFCKIEHIIEQKSKIPFRFRIGSLEEANRLEGK